jgi:hypothetical protein
LTKALQKQQSSCGGDFKSKASANAQHWGSQTAKPSALRAHPSLPVVIAHGPIRCYPPATKAS